MLLAGSSPAKQYPGGLIQSQESMAICHGIVLLDHMDGVKQVHARWRHHRLASSLQMFTT